MQQLFPHHRVLELDELYADVAFPERHEPYVVLGMATSIDGAVAVDGVSGGIGGQADRVAFRRLRDRCDVIMVGAGTVRAEDYGPPQPGNERQQERQRFGLAPTPQMAVVSATSQLEPDMRLFSSESFRPIVAVSEHADQHRLQRLQPHADLIVCGNKRVDLPALVAELRTRGLGRILCEGGPQLNNSLLEAELVDEIFMTISALVVGGGAPRMATGHDLPAPQTFELVSAYMHGSELLLRYRCNKG